MLKKQKVISIILIWVSIIAILLLTRSGVYQNLPTVEAEGKAIIDEQSAYQYVREVAEEYPYRIFGSKEVEELGCMIAEEFAEFGLLVSHQKFESWRPDSNKFFLKFDILDNDVRVMDDSLDDLIERVEGDNIIGISQGSSQDIILIGAHRDIAKGIQGAEDNASGTGLLLQLAKELSSQQHYYTYMFVSFDGEEAQEKGSRYFVRNYENIEKIKLSIILDEVGYVNADSLTIYEPYGAFSQTPLRLHSLLFSLMLNNTNSVPVYYDNTEEINGLQAFCNYVRKISFGSANTDSNPFFMEGIPAFGLRAWDKATSTEAPIHCNADTMENISADVLGMSGRFVKSMVHTLEAQPQILDAMMNDDKCVIRGNTYLPEHKVIVSEAFLVLIMLVIASNLLDISVIRKKITSILLICGLVLVMSVGVVLFVVCGIDKYLAEVPLFWLVFLLIGIVVLFIALMRRFVLNNSSVMAIWTQGQVLFTGIGFCVLFAVSNVEYAIINCGTFLVFMAITVCVGNKKQNAVWVFKSLWCLIYVIQWLATFNVFIRGVDIEAYVILHVVNVFMCVGMLLNTYCAVEKK